MEFLENSGLKSRSSEDVFMSSSCHFGALACVVQTRTTPPSKSGLAVVFIGPHVKQDILKIPLRATVLFETLQI